MKTYSGPVLFKSPIQIQNLFTDSLCKILYHGEHSKPRILKGQNDIKFRALQN